MTTKLFLDCEFTGLVKDAELISLCLYNDETTYFYAEFNDFTKAKINPWLKENVIPKLLYTEQNEIKEGDESLIKIKGNKVGITGELIKWLERFENIEIWGDVPAYDWVLFCDLFGGARELPAKIQYIPIDIATIAKIKGINVDFDRMEYVKELLKEETKMRHNTLLDAKTGKLCCDKILNHNYNFMNSQNTLKRLMECRVDFAYTKGNYFAAARRLKKEYNKKENLSRFLNIVAAGLAIFLLTALQLYISEKMGKSAIYVASLFAFASVIISLYLFFHKNPEIYIVYHTRGEEYLALYKYAKHIEAKFADGILTPEQLSTELGKIENDERRLTAIPLPVTENDRAISKKGIKEGQTEYTEEDFQKT